MFAKVLFYYVFMKKKVLQNSSLASNKIYFKHTYEIIIRANILVFYLALINKIVCKNEKFIKTVVQLNSTNKTKQTIHVIILILLKWYN